MVGVAVLLLNAQLSNWYGLPRSLILFMSAANVVYALYSFSLAARKERPKILIRLLVAANLPVGSDSFWVRRCLFQYRQRVRACVPDSRGAVRRGFRSFRVALEGVVMDGLSSGHGAS